MLSIAQSPCWKCEALLCILCRAGGISPCSHWWLYQALLMYIYIINLDNLVIHYMLYTVVFVLLVLDLICQIVLDTLEKIVVYC